MFMITEGKRKIESPLCSSPISRSLSNTTIMEARRKEDTLGEGQIVKEENLRAK